MRTPSACEVTHVPVDEMDQARLEDIALTNPPEGSQEEGVYVFPASLEQIRYWTLDQLDGASTASNMARTASSNSPSGPSLNAMRPCAPLFGSLTTGSARSSRRKPATAFPSRTCLHFPKPIAKKQLP
jgi:hypothetical protein